MKLALRFILLVKSSLGRFGFRRICGNQNLFGLWLFGLDGAGKPNMSVKGTRRTQALFEVCVLFGFVGFGLGFHPARPLLLR